MIATTTSIEPVIDQVLEQEHRCVGCGKQVMATALPECCECRYGVRSIDHFRFEPVVLDAYTYMMRRQRCRQGRHSPYGR